MSSPHTNSVKNLLRTERDSRIVKDKLFAALVFILSFVTISPIILIIGKLIAKRLPTPMRP